MAVLTTVAEWCDYVREPWPKGWWVDDSLIQVEVGGAFEDVSVDFDFDLDFYLSSYQPSWRVKIVGGVIVTATGSHEANRTLVGHFKAWRQKRPHTTFVVTVPKENAQLARDALSAIPGAILK